MSRTLQICKKHHGQSDAFNRSTWTRITLEGQTKHADPETANRSDLETHWRDGFIRMGYTRNLLCCRGMVSETFETAITWDRFEQFHHEVSTSVQAAIQATCGSGSLTCRMTHVYPDGP